MTDTLGDLLDRAAACGQRHIVKAAEGLDDQGRSRLAESLARVPWDDWDQLHALVVDPPAAAPPPAMRPPVACTMAQIDGDALKARGEEALHRGAVAVFTVAGGQGTRLGWNGPKGTFPATAITGKSLFQVQAERITAAVSRYGQPVRWYIMTSAENHEDTRRFLLDNHCFGIDRTHVQLVQQGMMPAFDATSGDLLMAGPDRLALSPDGHGGAFAALDRSGALEHMRHRGIEHISWVQIDNPLVRVLDPTFIGLHLCDAASSGEFSSKIVGRAHAAERVGVFVQTDAGMQVVEYSDFDESQAAAVGDDGELVWRAANIAVHLLSVEFMADAAAAGTGALPWHRAHKAVGHYCPAQGDMVTPDAPNAIKLERFVFDALSRARTPALLEVQRAEEFAPIKNASGDDSAHSSAALQMALHRDWLRQASVQVDDAAQVEISPLVAQWAEDLAGIPLPDHVSADAPFVLEHGSV